MFTQVTGDNLTDLWFNLMVHIATGNDSNYYSPSVFSRRIYGYTEGVHFGSDIMIKDFYKYSGYDHSYKLARLRESYFSPKVQKQYELLSGLIRKLQPRQARGLISFSEPAFNLTDRLKCLDSLYVQKSSMTTYEALIVFRNTEIWPKTYMDFVLLEEMLRGFIKHRVKCTMFSAFITSAFINVHQSAKAAMMMRNYGVSGWNEHFMKSLLTWKDKYSDPKVVDTLTMQFIKRIIKHTHELFEIDGVDIDMLIKGK